jgi:hypothetical protein
MMADLPMINAPQQGPAQLPPAQPAPVRPAAPPPPVDLKIEDAELEELPDGSAVFTMKTGGPLEDEDFYQNLADSEDIDSHDLNGMALRYKIGRAHV